MLAHTHTHININIYSLCFLLTQHTYIYLAYTRLDPLLPSDLHIHVDMITWYRSLGCTLIM